VVASEQEFILASCCGSPMSRNSVLEELRVNKLAVTKYIDRLPPCFGTRSKFSANFCHISCSSEIFFMLGNDQKSLTSS